jgi:hypothetical protein
MANFWAKRIGYDINRIDEVPKKWREEVRQIIEDMQPTYNFAGMTAAEVWRSLSYRPTKDEYQQACDWLGIQYSPNATNAELRALLAEAAGVEE